LKALSGPKFVTNIQGLKTPAKVSASYQQTFTQQFKNHSSFLKKNFQTNLPLQSASTLY
jgi:hypothetical protein